MAKSLQLILEIIATYRVLSHLLDDLRLKCRLRAQYMISKSNVKLYFVRCCVYPYLHFNNVQYNNY